MGNISEKLTKARISLVIRSPFFSNILLKRDLIETTRIPTFAVDAQGNILYNTDFADKLDVEELKFVLAHEAMHVALAHLARLGDRDPELWNIATDAVINSILVKAEVGRMIEGGVFMEGSDERTAEDIYKDLVQEKQGQSSAPDQGDGNKGKDKGLHTPSIEDILPDFANGMTESERQTAEANGKIEISQALQSARMMGKDDGYLERVIGKLITSKTPWFELLEKYMTAKSGRHLSWNRPNHRYLQTAYLPRREKLPSMGGVVVGIDCSGSITQSEVDEALGHITRICEECRPETLDVLWTTTEVQHVDTFTSEDYPLEVQPFTTSGGTDMREITTWAERNRPDAELVIILTDGYTPYPTDCDHEVLWVIKGSNITPPVGEAIYMEE